MKKRFFLIYLTVVNFLLYSCNGQVINQSNQKKMEIYEKQFDGFSIQFIRIISNEKIDWKTIYKKNNEEKIIYADMAIKNIGWKIQEERGESPIDLYNIAGTFYDDRNKSLYVIYNRFGEVLLHKYILEKDSFIKKEDKILMKYLMSGGFGKVINDADITKIKDKIYFILAIGQSGIKNPSQMFVINNNSLNMISKIEFENPIKIIKSVYINEFGVSVYNQEKTNPNKKEVTDLLKDNMEKKYFFIDMPVNKEQYEIKASELHDYGISNFKLFLKENSENAVDIDSDKIKKANTYINEASKNENQKIISYLFDKSQENILYFLVDENNIIKIVRFNNYNSDWLFGNYKETIVK